MQYRKTPLIRPPYVSPTEYVRPKYETQLTSPIQAPLPPTPYLLPPTPEYKPTWICFGNTNVIRS